MHHPLIILKFQTSLLSVLEFLGILKTWCLDRYCISTQYLYQWLLCIDMLVIIWNMEHISTTHYGRYSLYCSWSIYK